MANERSKLSDLAPEIWQMILENIPNDMNLLQLRLVDSLFNEMVLQKLAGIDFLQFIDNTPFDFNFRDSLDYMHPDALVDFKKVVIPLKCCYSNRGPVISRAVSFFHRICTLRALEFPDELMLSQIRDIAPNLLYIKAHSIINDCGLEDDEIVDLFHSLQAFDISWPKKPFCQKAWSQRGRSLIRWSNKCCEGACRKIGPPESARFFKFVSFDDGAQGKPITIADLDWLTNWNSVRVLCIKDAIPPCRLYLPELKCFELRLFKEQMQLSTLTNYIHHSGGLKHLTLCALAHPPLVDHDTSLSLLRFIGSLSNLTSLNLTLDVEKTTEQVTKHQPMLSKTKLKMVMIEFCANVSVHHIKLIGSIIDSSDVLMDFKLVVGSSSLRLERAENTLYFNGSELSRFRLFLSTLSNQRHGIKRLYFASDGRDDRDAAVAAVLALENVEEFNFMVDDKFLATWLTAFTKLQDRRALLLLWTNGLEGRHSLSEETCSLVAQAVEDGRIAKFTHSSNPSQVDRLMQSSLAIFENRYEFEEMQQLSTDM